MKKVLLVIACALVAISASAQIKIEGGVNLGGYNKGTLKGFSGSAGFFVNALYDIKLGDNGQEYFFLETGVGFLANNIKDNKNSSIINTSWVQIPVLFGSDFSLGNGYLTAALGVYYGRGVSGKIKNGGASMDIMNNSTSVTNIFAKNDLGFAFKFGYTFNSGIGILAGYEHGLLNLGANGGDIKSYVLNLGVSYKFF